MNFKTTLVLALVLIGLTGIYLMLPEAKEGPAGNSNANTAASEAKSLLGPDFAEARRVVVHRRDQPEWAFEKEGAETSAGWKMTAPSEGPAQKWMVDNIVSRLKSANVEERYAPGGAVTADEAGLSAPKTTLAVTDDDGTTVKVALGKEPADNKTYVRVGDSNDIVVVSGSFKDLVKDRAIEYRDQAMLSLKANTVRAIEIVDRREGKPVTYRLVQHGTDWVFDEPFDAPAVAKEIGSLTQALSSLRVAEWVEDAPRDPAMFGLHEPAITVSVTVEEPKAAPAPTTEPATQEAVPTTEKKTYAFNISASGPLGGDNKVFISRADSPAIGTVMKTVAERYYPKVNTWRDMHVTTAPVRTATRVEVQTPDGQSAFERGPTGWMFAETQRPAGEREVDTLLDAFAGLNATAFVESGEVEASSLGFENPQAVVSLTIPSQSEPIRLTVGGPTDAQHKLLTYVRVSPSDAVAKVRTADMATLIRSPMAYRDRTLAKVVTNELQEVKITREALAGAPMSFTLTRDGASWKITTPPTPTDSAAADGLVAAMSSLSGTAIVSEAGDAEAYGLDQPDLTVTLTAHSPLPEPTTEPAETQPAAPPVVTRVLFARKDGKVYAKRADSADILTVDPATYDKIAAELHATGLFTFDQGQVKTVEVAGGEGPAQGFTRTGPTSWKYNLEPDLPIEETKVKNFLVQLKDLKAARYVAYAGDSLSRYGLDNPQQQVIVTLEDGNQQKLLISANAPEGSSPAERFAVLGGSSDVFVLPADALTRLSINIAEYVSASGPKPQ